MRKQIAAGILAVALFMMACPEVMAAGASKNQTVLVKGKKNKKNKTFNAQKKIDKFLAKHESELKLTSDQVTQIKALSNATSKKELKKGAKHILTKEQKKQLKADHKAKKGTKTKKAGKKNKKNK